MNFLLGYSKSRMRCLIERILLWEGQIHHWTHLYRYIHTLTIKREAQTHDREEEEEEAKKRNDNYQTSIISCSARRAFIIVDDSLPEAFVAGIWKNVFKVRGIVFEEDIDESGWEK